MAVVHEKNNEVKKLKEVMEVICEVLLIKFCEFCG
jgi:hypothetical protein